MTCKNKFTDINRYEFFEYFYVHPKRLYFTYSEEDEIAMEWVGVRACRRFSPPFQIVPLPLVKYVKEKIFFDLTAKK